ncbi:hypothetical protein AgCh_034598 [Apium graveolens]
MVLVGDVFDVPIRKDIIHGVQAGKMATVQGNYIVEDQRQLVSGSMSLDDFGPQGNFVGVYHGHGDFTSDNEGMSADVINRAFLETTLQLEKRKQTCEHPYIVDPSLKHLITKDLHNSWKVLLTFLFGFRC